MKISLIRLEGDRRNYVKTPLFLADFMVGGPCCISWTPTDRWAGGVCPEWNWSFGTRGACSGRYSLQSERGGGQKKPGADAGHSMTGFGWSVSRL